MAFNTLSKTNLVENAKDKLLTEDKAIQKLWAEYCTELFGVRGDRNELIRQPAHVFLLAHY